MFAANVEFSFEFKYLMKIFPMIICSLALVSSEGIFLHLMHLLKLESHPFINF